MIIFDVEQVVATDTNGIGINITAAANSIADDFRVAKTTGNRGRIRFVVEAEANADPDRGGIGYGAKFFRHSHSQLRIFASVNCRNVGLFRFATSRCCPVYLLISYL